MVPLRNSERQRIQQPAPSFVYGHARTISNHCGHENRRNVVRFQSKFLPWRLSDTFVSDVVTNNMYKWTCESPIVLRRFIVKLKNTDSLNQFSLNNEECSYKHTQANIPHSSHLYSMFLHNHRVSRSFPTARVFEKFGKCQGF